MKQSAFEMSKGVKHIDFAVNIFSFFYTFLKKVKSSNPSFTPTMNTRFTMCICELCFDEEVVI